MLHAGQRDNGSCGGHCVTGQRDNGSCGGQCVTGQSDCGSCGGHCRKINVTMFHVVVSVLKSM